MKEPWRNLQVGDRVRIKCWPEELREEWLHEETRELYRWLIRTGSVLTISEIDAWGMPYGEIQVDSDADEEWHYLALNHSGLEMVTDP